MKPLAVVTDFDGTLMHEDVGDLLMHKLGVLGRPETKEVSRLFREKRIGSLEWIKVAYSFLAPHQREVDDIISRVRLRDEALEFLAFCRQESIPVTVLSDGMEYYVRQILARYEVEPARIIVNPIRFNAAGNYELGTQNRNAACRWCGCCKADVVKRMKEDGTRIVYIGDGSSDYYGSSFADWVFARGSLAAYLDNDGTEYYPFESFRHVLDVMEPAVDRFRDGSAERRITKTHPFCKFA